MALIKYGLGITQISGSQGGTTFARNRYGNYTRAKTKPVNPNSVSQVLARSAVGALTQRWRVSLSAAQRTAWQTYANAVAMKNKLGETIYLSGFNHYIRSNSYLSYTGVAEIDAGPTVLALPEKDPTLAVAISVATQQISVTFDNALPWANEDGGFLIIYQGEPQNATRNFFAGPWKYCYRIEGDSVAPPASPGAISVQYTAVLGQKSWVYARVFRADGRLSEPMVVSCIIGA